jgi:hypothetical protein
MSNGDHSGTDEQFDERGWIKADRKEYQRFGVFACVPQHLIASFLGMRSVVDSCGNSPTLPLLKGRLLTTSQKDDFRQVKRFVESKIAVLRVQLLEAATF